MKDALVRFFSSMKAWTLLIGILATLLLRWGINIDATTQAEILALVGILIGAQGITDHGKAAATITANAALQVAQSPGISVPDPAPATTDAPRAPQSGLAILSLMSSVMIVGVFALSIVAVGSCGPTKPTVASPSSVAMTAALIATTTAESAFLAYDHDHEINIAQSATSAEDAKTKLAAYRMKREKVNAGFAVWFEAVKTASRLRDDHSIEAIAVAALEVNKLVAELKVEGSK